MPKFLTLAEMADVLRISPRTFANLVVSNQIPYITTGRSKRFDPATVETILLRVEPVRNNVVKFTPARKRKAVVKGSFAEAVGL